MWAGENGAWQVLAAHFYSTLANGQEYWSASITLNLTKEQSLPGNIQCNVRYRVLANEYFANNDGHNYYSEADSGIKLTHNQSLQNVVFANKLRNNQQSINVTVAVKQSFNAENVTLHWTTNNWKTTKKFTVSLSVTTGAGSCKVMHVTRINMVPSCGRVKFSTLN